MEAGNFYFAGGDRFNNSREKAEPNSVTEFRVLESEVADFLKHGAAIRMTMGVPAGGKRIHDVKNVETLKR